MRVTSEGVRGRVPGHLPRDIDVDNELSDGWKRAMCKASTASQRRRCSGVRGRGGRGMNGRVGVMSVIVRRGVVVSILRSWISTVEGVWWVTVGGMVSCVEWRSRREGLVNGYAD